MSSWFFEHLFLIHLTIFPFYLFFLDIFAFFPFLSITRVAMGSASDTAVNRIKDGAKRDFLYFYHMNFCPVGFSRDMKE